MNLLESVGFSLIDSEELSYDELLASSRFMSGDEARVTSQDIVGLDAHEDARTLVRLIQCSKCSLPFRIPITLPCGHSHCRDCLPQPHHRENISYPNTPDRRHGVVCPVQTCQREHPVGECDVDVTLSKIMEAITDVTAEYQPASEDTPMLLEEIKHYPRADSVLPEKEEDSMETPEPRSQVLNGGRLAATLRFAQMGFLDFEAEVGYQTLSKEGDDYRPLGERILTQFRESVSKELDCQVCYNLMYDPVTTPCGHTFCRKCLVRVLDHSSHCPICRRTLPIPPSLDRQPSNQRLKSLLVGLCPDLVAARAEAVEQEERGTIGELDVPLFVCTLGFPSMPTFLHIFEPRYRLMIRRALEGNRTFGMLMYNRAGQPQGDLGNTHFLQYGTMLRILNVQMLPDGRSLIECIGTTRFKVLRWSQLDGYIVGSVERIEDVSLAEEERIEAEETSVAAPALNAPPTPDNISIDPSVLVNRLSTRRLLIHGVEFIEKMRANSAPWLHQRILDAYGQPPDDPALFPYWFACVLPIADEEKYLLLSTTSVRERLKIVVNWIRRIEGQRWYAGSSCTVL
ncbi:hypothetical protein M501DRAFT_994205 [Patellaria atrata CBS 101060]|uniref:ATP-dependent protease n=1 Tax=Patellaria atrata CBS 101060 TaxID=1346257 RepID=A0A9P4VV93_9PEZI|nr:hypothetical protein M501DRAFT_994205 [Patellaria atrata CBS 101060]